MQLKILDGEAGKATFLQLVDSRDWWLLLAVDDPLIEAVMRVIRAAEADGQVLFVPTAIGPVGVGFVRKSRFSWAELNRALEVPRPERPERERPEQDVLLLAYEGPSMSVVVEMGKAIHATYVAAQRDRPACPGRH